MTRVRASQTCVTRRHHLHTVHHLTETTLEDRIDHTVILVRAR